MHQAPKLVHQTEQPDSKRYHQSYAHHHGTDLSSSYNEIETPHSKEVFKAKPVTDPNIHYHDFSDFPPDFYKADFYEQYETLGADILGHPMPKHAKHYVYEPLKVHNYSHDGKGFYYFDDHQQTDMRRHDLAMHHDK